MLDITEELGFEELLFTELMFEAELDFADVLIFEEEPGFDDALDDERLDDLALLIARTTIEDATSLNRSSTKQLSELFLVMLEPDRLLF